MASFLTGCLGASAVYDTEHGDIVQLIEIGPESDGRSFCRSLVNDAFARDWVLNDFGVPTTTSQYVHQESSSESLKLLFVDFRATSFGPSFSLKQGEYNGAMLPISIDENLFQRIAPYARLPKTYIESLQYNAALHLQASPELPGYILKLSENTSVSLGDEYLSFIIQTTPAMAHICAGSSFTFHFKSRRMYVFMHGLPSPQIHQLPAWLESGAARESYFLIPSIIIHTNLRMRSREMNSWHDDIYRFETLLGVRNDHGNTPDLTTINFNSISKDLNAATTNLAFYAWQCKTNVRTLDFMDDIARRYRVLAVNNGYGYGEAAAIERVLLDTHEHLRCWNASLADRVEYLSKRGQALVQTVYSGIAQRDSAHSLNLAATSTELSKISFQIGVAMSQDSALMRIIAAITVFFLPATFTATFFSTSFFDFHGGRNDPVASWWLWLYFLVTVILTAVTMAGTSILWQRESKAAIRKAAVLEHNLEEK